MVDSLSWNRVSKDVVCACLTVSLPSIYWRNEGNQQTVGGYLVYVRSSFSALFSLVAYFVRADKQ